MNRPVRDETGVLWDEQTLRDPHAREDKARRVRAMFDAIAHSYERVNRIVSLGQDARWRKRAVALAEPRPGEVVLDVCCGTGDMIRTFARTQPGLARIVGVDFAGRMLRGGRYDGLDVPVHLLRADGLRLPLRDACADIVSCAFGVRNFQDLDAGLREFARVLRPGGRCVILEFAMPESRLVRWGYRVYSDRVLPLLATWVSRDRTGAYRYLPRSIETFDRPDQMVRRLEGTGFEAVRAVPLNLGTVVIYAGRRGGGGQPSRLWT